jgi:hypothetical protein
LILFSLHPKCVGFFFGPHSRIFIVMTIKHKIDNYFGLDTPDKLEVLKVVSKEVLDIIEYREFNKDETILFLDLNIELNNVEENYEISEILTKIKEIIEEDDGM